MGTDPFFAPDRVNSIGEILSSCVCDFAAAGVNSYSGGNLGLWENVEQDKSPADTNPQSASPLRLGSGSTSPTFTGRPGEKGSHFLLDGGDFFFQEGRTTTGLSDGFAKDWHIDQDFTVIMTFERKAGTFQTLFSTKAPGSNIGVTGFINAINRLSISQRGDTATDTKAGTTTLTADTKYIVSFDHDHSANTTGFRVGTSTRESVAQTFNATSSAATTPLLFAASIDATLTTPSLFMTNGTKIYDIIICNALVSDGDFASVITALEARNGEDFTP